MRSSTQGTPYIPAAWKREEIPQVALDLALYTEPVNGGMVTVDYANRVFRLGLTRTGPVNSTRKYSGRGWRQQLEQDATAYLHAAVNGK